ncbi:MAG TPA: ECF-type sigma factor [Planctomycetaceae bacterium]|nr:ECF-type sigma factor [Planctomycetaceae bacterium]
MSSLLRQTDGPLTRELLLAPGRFGLGHVPERLAPDATTRMICGFCSTGCALNIHLRDGTAVNLSPAAGYPVNLGMACPKGWEALAPLAASDRATTPLVRNSAGRLVPVDWPTALGTFVARFKAIQARHGRESVAFLSTGQLPTEEMALLGVLAKFGMGVLHGDGNTRQCMATAVTAYKESFGFDAPPYTYADFEESDAIVLVGSNLCIAHPILWERVLRNRRRPEIVVIDPRRTETAMQATLHLPLAPKSDLVLFYGIARLLIENAWIDDDFIDASTGGFEEFARHVEPYTPNRVAAATGLPEDLLRRFARILHERERVSFWWTMGVNQSYEGVRTAQSLINLALMTGNVGRPGTGANSITGQCNAMGSRLFSNTTCLFGGRDFTNPRHRAEVAETLDLDPSAIPDRPSWAYPEIMEGILRGAIRGLWVIGTNPAHSWINQNQARDILSRLDVLVVQDMYHTTETARMADLVLPAAGWGEKDGTFINSERRLGVIRKVARAPGQALTDFAIFRLIAEAWGCAGMFREWESPERVFEILKRLSAGQPCDITGIDGYEMLDACGGIQWPWPAARSGGFQPPPPRETSPSAAAGSRRYEPLIPGATERRLFEDGRFYHPDGRARFVFEQPRPLSEPPSRQYPFLLLTGRGSAAQWHTQTRTGKSAVLNKLAPQTVYAEINPHDARRLGIRPHEWVRIESQRGSIRARSFITPTIQPGQVFVPMHYQTANELTDAVFDPYSRQPSYKACAVSVRPDGTHPHPRYTGKMTDLTMILHAVEKGDTAAAGQLLPLVYDELRKLAAARMANEKPGQTLQATALVHEAWLRLVDTERAQHWDSRAHFFAAAAEAMRRILVERARARRRQKRGGRLKRRDLDAVELADDSRPDLVLAIDDALEHLAAEDERMATLVKLRCFAGFTLVEAAEALGVSRSTAIDDWDYARSRLRILLGDAES